MNARANVRTSVWERMLPWGMPALLIVGLVLRIAVIGDDGFKNDVQTFEAWSISLLEHGLGKFYDQAGFADYPPGYFYILAVVGHIWAPLRASDPTYGLLKALVKLPAILADLGVGALIYAFGVRFGRRIAGFGAAAFYVLNPVTIFISAKWGQVDAIAGGLALLAVYFLLRSDDEEPAAFSWWIVASWAIFAYSLLIKPQAAILIPLFIAFAFVDPQRRRARALSTLAGIGAAFVVAIGLSEPFHPANPVSEIVWLLGRYSYGSSVYSYNSVNAFNLWTIKGEFWNPDSTRIAMLPQYLWGIVLVVAAAILIVWRYVQARTDAALVEASAIALLAFYVLSTRMHERYVFDGLLFAVACIPLARRYLWGAIALSVLLLFNLNYSLHYLDVMTAHTPGADAQNLWGAWTHVLSLAMVAAFFALGYAFLGNAGVDERPAEREAPVVPRPEVPAGETWSKPNDWFDPREGLAAMRAPLDYVVMSLLGLFSFILSFVNYWYPADKIFDEIYFARAAEEYLQNVRIYENTHPPLSKLLVTLSVMLFGGMGHGHGLGGWHGLNGVLGHMHDGDNSYGWRFLDVVAGGVVVMLLYAFAKRITGSTIFATVAALLLTFDGMHFVQSRIATPEGFVVCFSLLAVYAFYRFWIASQVEERRHVNVPAIGYVFAVAGSLLGAVALVAVWKAMWHDLDVPSTIVFTGYASLGLYLLARYVVLERIYADGKTERTFADGSYALLGAGTTAIYACDGGSLEVAGPAKPAIRRGALSQARGGELLYEGGDVTIAYRGDASVAYTSPAGSATYAQNEILAGPLRERGRSATLWLLLFTVALGLLVSAKWYGVMGFSVSFLVLIFVWLQKTIFDRRPMLWGNPRGFRLDGALATIVFVSATVYGLVWMPDLVRHGQGDIQNFNDVVSRQYDMFEYHDHLTATHPYSSKWWEWPIDWVPIAYYYQDRRHNQADDNGCCIYEITSLPNPINMWFGLLCVPLVGFLAWKERNKGYALIVLTDLLQWLPWLRSPRITFAYHFYVDIPLICLCNAIVLQRIWRWAVERGPQGRWLGGALVGGYVLLIGGVFAFFYPVLAATGITHAAWQSRMWINPTWIVGPG